MRYGPGDRGFVVYLAFLLQEFVLVSVAGATIGKQLFHIRVVRLDGGRLAWPWVLARTVLLGVLVPAAIWDRDGRGLHDRATGALTVRVGPSAPASARAATARPASAASAAGKPGAAAVKSPAAPRASATERPVAAGRPAAAAKRRRKRR
jgi:hypothetical protein